MAAWQLVIGPDTKTNVAAALAAATIADAHSTDAPKQDLVGNETVEAHFAAAMTSAQAQLAALTGPAAKAKVTIHGYEDPSVNAQVYNHASRIQVLVSEVW